MRDVTGRRRRRRVEELIQWCPAPGTLVGLGRGMVNKGVLLTVDMQSELGEKSKAVRTFPTGIVCTRSRGPHVQHKETLVAAASQRARSGALCRSASHLLRHAATDKFYQHGM